MAKRRNFSAAFKAKVALEDLRGDQTLAELATRHKVHPNLITKWKRQAGEGLVDFFSGKKLGRCAANLVTGEHTSTLTRFSSSAGRPRCFSTGARHGGNGAGRSRLMRRRIFRHGLSAQQPPPVGM